MAEVIYNNINNFMLHFEKCKYTQLTITQIGNIFICILYNV